MIRKRVKTGMPAFSGCLKTMTVLFFFSGLGDLCHARGELLHGFAGSLDQRQQTVLDNLQAKETTKRYRLVTVHTAQFIADGLSINLFDDIQVTAYQSDIGATGVSSDTWTGNLLDSEGSVCFVRNGDRIAGKINSIQGNFAVYPLGQGIHIVVQLNMSRFGGCNTKSDKPVNRQEYQKQNEPEFNSGKYSPQLPSTGTEPNIRVIVAYTNSAQTQALVNMGLSMKQLVELAVLESNQGYANSNVNQRIELAYLYETSYTETGSLPTDLARFQNPVDGSMDEVHILRDFYDADMCALITDGSTANLCGIAHDFVYWDPTNMFQITEYDCATGNFSFAHEFGHTQGCRHDNDNTIWPFLHGHGYNQGAIFRTIMAVFDSAVTRVNYWSNPLINFPGGGGAMGMAGWSENARALDEGEATVIAHRIAPDIYALDDSIGNDEIADKYAASELSVENFSAESGSKVTLRSDNSVLLLPGFKADPGSAVQVYIGNSGATRTSSSKLASQGIFRSKADSAQFAPKEVESAMEVVLPYEFSLAQNYPNPFNPYTTIKYGLKADVHVSLKIYDILGEQVRVIVDEPQSAGYSSVVWNGEDADGKQVSSGVYFYRLVAGEFVQTRRMLIAR